MAIINKDLEELLSREINELGFMFVGLELEGHEHNKLLRIYVDISEDPTENIIDLHKTRVTVEDCSNISRYLYKFMSTIENLNIRNYMLEVSSPGLDRRLFNLSQFVVQLGKEIKLRLRSPINGRSNFSGILQEVDCKLNKIFVEVDKQQICFDYDNIVKANLVYRNCN